MNRQVTRFPESGLDADAVLAQITDLKAGDAAWKDGRMFGYVYHSGGRESKVFEQSYRLFCHENALNPSLFSSLRKIENETVAMVADLLHAGNDYAGNMTSGGSESIIMMVSNHFLIIIYFDS